MCIYILILNSILLLLLGSKSWPTSRRTILRRLSVLDPLCHAMDSLVEALYKKTWIHIYILYINLKVLELP